MISAESTKTFTARMFEFDVASFVDKHQLAVSQNKETNWQQKTADKSVYLMDISKLKTCHYLGVFFDKAGQEFASFYL